MKSILKKNQVIISVIAIMLIAAGYMSYTTGSNNFLQTALITDSEEYAGLGDAQLVSSEVANIQKNEEVLNEESNQVNEENVTENQVNSNNETVETSAEESNNSYFAESRIEREKMYSQMLESYQKLLENTQISESQKEIAQQEVKKINDTKNALMIAENLIKNKGFEDVIIFVNGNSVNIVIKAENLSTEQIAQVQNIVTRELEQDIENVHISCKS